MPRGMLVISIVVLWLAISSWQNVSEYESAGYRHGHKTAQADGVADDSADEKSADKKLAVSKVPAQLRSSLYPAIEASHECFSDQTIFSKRDEDLYKAHRTFLI